MDLNRAPTKIERLVGVIGATILCIVFLASAITFGIFAPEGEDSSRIGLIVSTVLCAGSFWLFYRVAFTAANRFPDSTVKRISFILVIVRAISISAGLLLQDAIIFLALGFTAIGGAISNMLNLNGRDA